MVRKERKEIPEFDRRREDGIRQVKEFNTIRKTLIQHGIEPQSKSEFPTQEEECWMLSIESLQQGFGAGAGERGRERKKERKRGRGRERERERN